MLSIPTYVLAAFAEIGGCFTFWAWLRLGKSMIWLLPGMASLAVFAWLLTRIEADFAGRAYAAYGGVYILASLVWLWLVEGHRPDRWDVLGAGVCLSGAAIILFAPPGRPDFRASWRQSVDDAAFSVGQTQQRLDRLDTEAEIASLADEGQPPQILLTILAVACRRLIRLLSRPMHLAAAARGYPRRRLLDRWAWHTAV